MSKITEDMKELSWHTGSPPHVGWWNAAFGKFQGIWRWWNGVRWSLCAHYTDTPEEAGKLAEIPVTESATTLSRIYWSDYWPENARVPRIDPRRI